MDKIKETVRNYLVENFLFGDTSFLFSDSDSLMDKGIIDSTGVLELITFLETTYQFEIEVDEILQENLGSVNNIENFIRTKLAAKKQHHKF